MSFIQWLGDWLRKVSTSVKSITAGTNSLTYTRHNNDSVTIPLTLESDLYVKKTGDTVTGNINSLYGVDGVETVNQFSGEMAGDDLWAIRTGVTGRPDPEGAATGDNGFLEIATADNGTEPIYISQYIGDHILPDSQGERFYQLHRRATLLDEQGNTVFPGTVTASSFNGNATSASSAGYATSAGTAAKLGTSDVGSATQPIYLEGGVATACTYQLYKTVPVDAVFTDTVYTHPTTSGNKHIPSGGSSGQILRWSADGTAEWGADNDTTYNDATQSSHGLMSATDKAKLDNTATAWTDHDTQLMTASVLRSVIRNVVGVESGHFADGHTSDLNYQTACITRFNGWDSNAANYPTGAKNKYCVSILIPGYNNAFITGNTNNLYEITVASQILISESGDVWGRTREGANWGAWRVGGTITCINETSNIVKELDSEHANQASKAFRIGNIAFVVLNDTFVGIDTPQTYYKLYTIPGWQVPMEVRSLVSDELGRIIGMCFLNNSGEVQFYPFRSLPTASSRHLYGTMVCALK